MNAFLKNIGTKNTYTQNGALSNSTSGSELLDQFGKVPTFAKTKRNIDTVQAEMALIWGENPELAMKALLYWRMVTRKSKTLNGNPTQKGQGIRYEYFQRMLWVAENHPKTFIENMHLLPEVGSWKDFIVLYEMDTKGVIKLSDVFTMFAAIFNSDESAAIFNAENIKKYLPTLRSKKQQNTAHLKKMGEFVREFRHFFEMDEVTYRKFKASGVSHKFQRDICNKDWDSLNFSTIGGRFIGRLTKMQKGGSTFLMKWGLEKKYIDWLSTRKVVAFTGYPFELYKRAKVSGVSLAETFTINKQFDGLIATAKSDGGAIRGNVWCALDTSGSMSTSIGDGTTALDVCVSLGIYFSALNEGEFKDSVIMFDSTSKIKKLSGSFMDKVKQVPSNAMGSTNFQSVIDEIVRVRKANPSIPVSDFPETLVVVSDMQFNPTGATYMDSYRGSNYGGAMETNYEAAMRKLEAVGLPRITIVWWHVNGRVTDQPVVADQKGTILVGGFDGAVISNLLGGKTKDTDGNISTITPYEAMMVALDQEVLSLVKVVG